MKEFICEIVAKESEALPAISKKIFPGVVFKGEVLEWKDLETATGWYSNKWVQIFKKYIGACSKQTNKGDFNFH